jgi:hypothetical protein
MANSPIDAYRPKKPDGRVMGAPRLTAIEGGI